MFKGNYDEYLYHKEYLKKEGRSFEGKPNKKKQAIEQSNKNPKRDYTKRKELKKLESRIEKLEKEISSLMAKFEMLEYGTDAYSQATKKLTELQTKLKENNNAWEQMMGDA